MILSSFSLIRSRSEACETYEDVLDGRSLDSPIEASGLEKHSLQRTGFSPVGLNGTWQGFLHFAHIALNNSNLGLYRESRPLVRLSRPPRAGGPRLSDPNLSAPKRSGPRLAGARPPRPSKRSSSLLNLGLAELSPAPYLFLNALIKLYLHNN